MQASPRTENLPHKLLVLSWVRLVVTPVCGVACRSSSCLSSWSFWLWPSCTVQVSTKGRETARASTNERQTSASERVAAPIKNANNSSNVSKRCFGVALFLSHGALPVFETPKPGVCHETSNLERSESDGCCGFHN